MSFSDRTRLILQAADRRISGSRPESPSQRFEACWHALETIGGMDSFYGGWFGRDVLTIEFAADNGVPYGGDVIPYGPRGLSAHIMATGRTYRWRDDDGLLIHRGVRYGDIDRASRDAAIAPITDACGTVIGLLAMLSNQPEAFDDEAVAALEWLTVALAVSRDNHLALTERLDLTAVYPDLSSEPAAHEALLSLDQDLVQLDHLIRAAASGEDDLALQRALSVVRHARRQIETAHRPGLPPPTAHDLRVLTTRERELAELLLRNGALTNREMARRLSISEYTVRGHMTNILAKLGVSNRAELIDPGLAWRDGEDHRESHPPDPAGS